MRRRPPPPSRSRTASARPCRRDAAPSREALPVTRDCGEGCGGVCAPHAHARIVSIDTSHAREMPGVRAVVTHEDVPGTPLHGRGPCEPVSLRSVPTTRGHPSPHTGPAEWAEPPSSSSTRCSNGSRTERLRAEPAAPDALVGQPAAARRPGGGRRGRRGGPVPHRPPWAGRPRAEPAWPYYPDAAWSCTSAPRPGGRDTAALLRLSRKCDRS
ncbi:hypothetical protein H4N49_13700 [Streptomyces sp. DHE17-7]|nr:hypothetical protein [Streptomyces sp. DHE17-7]